MRRMTIATVCLFVCVVLVGCGGSALGAGTVPDDAGSSASTQRQAVSAEASAPAPPDSLGASAGAGGAPTAPSIVAEGKQLGPLRSAPLKTYAMFDLPTPFKGAEFELTGRPYGWVAAPKGVDVRRMVLRVDEAKALSGQTDKFAALSGQTDKFADLNGANALVWVDSRTYGADTANEGGTYTVKVMVRPTGKTGVLYATSIGREK